MQIVLLNGERYSSMLPYIHIHDIIIQPHNANQLNVMCSHPHSEPLHVLFKLPLPSLIFLLPPHFCNLLSLSFWGLKNVFIFILTLSFFMETNHKS